MAAGFENRLFISFAHDDNEPFMSGQEGFVNRLHKSLEVILKTRGFRDVRIWMDRGDLKGNDVLAEELDGQVSNAAVLISVISPAYMTSDWCKRELTEFCEAAEKTSGLLFGNKSRVFKIVKLPPDNEEGLPPVMKGMLGYRFFTMGEDETPRELDPVYGPESAQQYAIRVTTLAGDIAQLIKLLSAHSADAAPTPDSRPAKPAVYLAECAYDRWNDRESLAAELKMRGYPVLPQSQLPRDEARYIAEVSRLLGGCRLSIHLVGSGYGLVPDGPGQKSVVMIQNDLAIERSRSAGLQRIIWLPEGTKSSQPPQQSFIDALLGDASVQFGADLITGNFESLKETVRTALQKLDAPEPPKPADRPVASPKLICIICDGRDREATIPLRRFLQANGLDSQIPVFEGDSATVRRANQESLVECDAAIVFYGAGDEAWKRTIDSELRKIKGYRPDKPMAPIYFYLSSPETTDKKEVLELEANVIDGLHGFSEAAMHPLLQMLRQAT
jgi:hypothetical protein